MIIFHKKVDQKNYLKNPRIQDKITEFHVIKYNLIQAHCSVVMM